MASVCDDCGVSFKSARGVKQHQRNSNCPGPISNRNTSDSATKQPEYRQLALHNDLLEFKTHINSVVNSLGNTFYSEITNLQTQVEFLCEEIIDKLGQNNAKFTEIDQKLSA